MPSSDWLTIRVKLQDGARTEAQLAALGAEVEGVGRATRHAAESTRIAKIETFGWNEGLYVLKRHIATLVLPLLALDGAVLKMGYDFDEAKANGTDALSALTGGIGLARQEMTKLVGLTHDSGLGLGDLVTGARNLLTFGFNLRQTNAYLKTFAAYSQAKGLGSAGVASLSGLFQRIKDRGFLTSRDALQLDQLGIPSNKALTKGLHLTQTQSWELKHGQLEVPANFALPSLATWLKSYTTGLKKPLSEQISIGKSWLSQLFGDFDAPLFAKLEKDAPRIDAFMARLTKGFERGGAKGFFTALDPSGTATKGWIILANAGRTLIAVIGGLWSIVKAGMPLLALVGGLLGIVAKHATLVKVAIYGLAGVYGAMKLLALGAKLDAAGIWAYGLAMRFAGEEAIVMGVATDEATGSMWGLDAAIAANPIGALILGLTAAGVGFYLLYTRVSGFRSAVNGTFSWIQQNWPLLGEIVAAPFTLGMSLALTHLGRIWDFLKALYGWVDGHVFTLHWVNKLPGQGLISAVMHPERAMQQGVTGLLHSLPGAAAGGTTTTAGLVLVGERGPEVLNLPAGATVSPLTHTSGVAPILAPQLGQGQQAAPEWIVGALVRALERIRIETADVKADGKKIAEIAFGVVGDAGARA